VYERPARRDALLIAASIVWGATIGATDELPPARAVLCDVTPRQLLLPPEFQV
jgi:hypothetical protein